MQSKNVKRLVVDASVAGATGGEEATASVSINCTEFLKTFRGKCTHHIVMTLEIAAEWDKHQSKFASTWRNLMMKRQRYDLVTPSVDQALRDQIEETATHENQLEVIRKDFRLLEAALETDQTIISLDETIRKHFTRAAQSVDEIQDIVWVNPDHTEAEQPLDWLRDSAPPEEHRKLRNQS